MFARDEKTAAQDEQKGLLSAPSAPVGTLAGGAWQLDDVLRRGFIRKVYGILTAQLFLTFGMIFLFVFVTPVKVSLCGMSSTAACEACAFFNEIPSVDKASARTFRREPATCMFAGKTPTVPDSLCNLSPSGGCFRPTAALSSTLTTAMLLSFVVILAIVCGGDRFSRVYPTNYMALFAFTACEAVTLAITCLFVDAAAVGLASAMTALVTAGLTYYACYTKVDFTSMGAYLYAGLLTLFVCSFVGSFFSYFYATPMIQNLYAGGGCLLFSCYIVYDTQLIVGGRHAKFQFGVDDYVFAALNIYLDIINLFIYILRILNQRER